MKKFLMFVLLFALWAIGVAFAADPSPLPTAAAFAPTQALTAWGIAVAAFKVSSLAASVGAVIEFLLRVIPSSKPLSIGYAASDFCHAFGTFFESLADAMDSLLPNRLKVQPPAQSNPPNESQK